MNQSTGKIRQGATARPANASEPSDRGAIPPFAALRAFEAVGRLGGIRRAAQALSLDHGVVSRHLQALESWAGIQLVDRTVRGGTLTAEGALYHARVSAAIMEIARATADLIRRADDSHLRVWAVPGFAFQWLTAHLSTFRAAYPDLEIELRPTDQSPDFLRQEADIDIRCVLDGWPRSETKGVNQLEFARPPVIAVASPECLAALPPDAGPADLVHAPLLHEDSQDQWRVWFAAHGVEVDERLPGPRLWHAHVMLDACRRGEGVALANAYLLGKDLERGSLVRVGGETGRGYPASVMSYVLYAREDRWLAPPVSWFRHWLQKAIQDTARRS